AARDDRVLFLAPTNKDAAHTQALLSRAGIRVETFASFDELVLALWKGAAVIALPEDAFSSRHNEALRRFLAQQPPWSDLPVLVMTRPGADSLALKEAVRTLGNVTLLERPLRGATLLSAVQTALRARARQYQIRGHLAERARAEESLRVADQRKDEFLATLGHELRNPLAPLVTGLKVISLAKVANPVVQQVLPIMERQVGHLTRLVEDLLEVSRITRGMIDVQPEPLDLAFVVRSAIETSRPSIEGARHELTVDLPTEPITVFGDGVRLTQVFANLLTNAAKYTDQGGHIALSVTRRSDTAVISVRDDGIGIPAAQLTSVFDMFTQIDRSNRRTQGGLGIGLTLVRSLVAQHGGRVEARSAGSGMGSEFLVELPVMTIANSSGAPAREVVKIPPLRILVVDDNRDAAETLGVLLTALGATASVVGSGAEALAQLDSFRPDTVLLDIGMPQMDGYEVARRIRDSPKHRGVLMIALTGWGQEHDRQRSRAAGFDHHFVKPLDVERLSQLLAVERREAARPKF
ncbi:MAG TPA: ATP-binding protein, partial [Vicinamibacteria bacterium]|nr:ATP-binding protein [Vicinamibacteria bacterium]